MILLFPFFWLNIWDDVSIHRFLEWFSIPKAMARSWSCIGAMLPWTATRRSTRGWRRWPCRGSVVPLFRFINRNNQHWDFQIMHWILKRRVNGTIFVSFKDPSYCDDPLGGKNVWNLKGLRCFLSIPTLVVGNGDSFPDTKTANSEFSLVWNDTNLARLISHVYLYWVVQSVRNYLAVCPD